MMIAIIVMLLYDAVVVVVAKCNILRNLLQAATCSQLQETCLVFDWDDTILPTTVPQNLKGLPGSFFENVRTVTGCDNSWVGQGRGWSAFMLLLVVRASTE